MLTLLDGEAWVAQAWQLSTEPNPPWRVWLNGGEYLTVNSEADVETLFQLITELTTKRNQDDAYERDDPETAEPVPSYVEGWTEGAGPARVAV